MKQYARNVVINANMTEQKRKELQALTSRAEYTSAEVHM